MGFLKDASNTFIKISELIVDKTETFTKLAKLNLEIKKLKGEQERIKYQLADAVFQQLEKKQFSLDLTGTEVTNAYEQYKSINNKIKSIQNDIDALKDKKTSSGEQKPEKDEN